MIWITPGQPMHISLFRSKKVRQSICSHGKWKLIDRDLMKKKSTGLSPTNFSLSSAMFVLNSRDKPRKRQTEVCRHQEEGTNHASHDYHTDSPAPVRSRTIRNSSRSNYSRRGAGSIDFDTL